MVNGDIQLQIFDNQNILLVILNCRFFGKTLKQKISLEYLFF